MHWTACASARRSRRCVRGRRGVEALLEGPDGQSEARLFDQVLVAVGRAPNSRIDGLDRTAVELDGRGFVVVDAHRRTAEPAIFAIGDVAGEPLLAHKAFHEARAAVETIAGRPAAFEPLAVPAVVFTDPEVAWCGLTETQAAAAGRSITVSRFPWGASGRALTLDRPDGVTKLVIDPDTEQLLGVGMAGAGAGELIAEGVLAVEMGATVSDLRLSIHPHPTLSETVAEAADLFFGECTHLYRPKRGLARISHQPSAADADPLALTGRTPARRFDVVSTTPAASFSPCAPSPRRLDALATNAGEKCGLAHARGRARSIIWRWIADSRLGTACGSTPRRTATGQALS